MSVYQHPKSPHWQYDFQINGNRFHGSISDSSVKTKAQAREAEKRLKEQARKDLELKATTGDGPMTIDRACGRYWLEVGQHHKQSKDTQRALGLLVEFFGKTKRLDAITDSDVASLVAWRRSQRTQGREDGGFVSPATVNRTTLVPLKAIFTRAKKTWRQPLPLEPNWRGHWLPIPEERVRELDAPEGEALDSAVRDDYADWFEFARITGLRRNETLIKWAHVNQSAKRITTIGKRGRKVSTRINKPVAAILERCKGHHPVYVFTYVCRHPGEGQRKGERYPITEAGAKTQWRRLRAKAGVQDFRFHDIRHDVATKVLRATGNMKLVQKALNHANIATTAKYAHVLDEEVGDALETVAESRKKYRNEAGKAA